MPLPVVLHPDVTDFLRTKFQRNLKDNTWKCIDKLRQQNFDGGLRVKKLRGISKRVWEARVSRAIRLIFTYESSINLDTKEPQRYLAVQDICLDHDDVSRRAKARIRNFDAQWLDLEEIETIGNLEIELEGLAEEQLAVLQAEEEDLQVQDNIGDELLGNIPWQVLNSESDWHQAIVNRDKNLPLKLSVEESDLAKHYGHLLLSGSAGTGKTTVGVYQLLKSLETLPAGQRLYLAYNPILVKETREQFAKLVGSKIAKIEPWFQFRTIQNLCSQILSQAGSNYLECDEVNYQVFERLYCRQPDSKKYPPALAWDEIRSIVKGSYLKTDKRLFSLSEYTALGRNQSSVIAQQERPNIYRIAQWYQRYLTTNKRFDEIDLARLALKYIQQGQSKRYQMIVCDEVQDLTELQLHLLMQLITPDGHLFFAGDLNQMISPSGFRWEDLKSLFYNSEHLGKTNRQVIEKKLQFNFRSVSSLVQLANQLLILRSRLLSENISDRGLLASQSNRSVLWEKSARLINAPLSKIEPIVQQLYSGDAVLVRTQEQKEEISRRLDSSLVFTIEEAKGLEFDTVFLVEFFLPYQDLWQKAIDGIPALKDREIPQLRLELNLLYVAITRARRILNVWENRFSIIWNQPELVDLVQHINAESARKERLESTVQDWQEKGLYYLEHKRYRQALECFENSGDIKSQWQASAKLALQEEEYIKAAELYVRLNHWQQAARLFEKNKQWNEAADCWGKAGNTDKQHICEACALEAEYKWEDAAQRWETIAKKYKSEKSTFKYLQKAWRCWLKSDNEQKKIETRTTVAREHEKRKQWNRAADYYKQAGKLDKAAEQYRLAKMSKKAAECKAIDWENRKQWQKAADCWSKLGNIERQQVCKAKESARCRAQNYETKQQWLMAVEQYTLAEMNKEVNSCRAKNYETKQQWLKAAEQYALAGMKKKAAELFEQEQQWLKAAEQYELAGLPKNAVLCRRKIGY